MINNNQIKALTEDELSYLYYCCNKEWESKNMSYEMDINTMKCFRNNSIQQILMKQVELLKEEHKNIVANILNKLTSNA